MTRLTLTALMIVAALGMSACIGGKKVTNVSTATVGQQIEDLDKAYKDGLLTEEEYNKKRKQLLKS